MGKYKGPRKNRFRNFNRKNVSDVRQSELVADVGADLVGDYEKRRTGKNPAVQYMPVLNLEILLALGKNAQSTSVSWASLKKMAR